MSFGEFSGRGRGHFRTRICANGRIRSTPRTSSTCSTPRGRRVSPRRAVDPRQHRQERLHIGECMKLGPEDRVCTLSRSSTASCPWAPSTPSRTRGRWSLAESFDAEVVLKAVDQEGCSALLGVPTMFIAELDSPGLRTVRHQFVAHGHHGRFSLSDGGHEEGRGRDRASEITIAYGQTESSPVTQTRTDDPLEPRLQRRTQAPTWRKSHLERRER